MKECKLTVDVDRKERKESEEGKYGILFKINESSYVYIQASHCNAIHRVLILANTS